MVALGAAWFLVRVDYVGAGDIARYLAPRSQLARVHGFVQGPLHLRSPQRGAFGGFSHGIPSTHFVLDLRRIEVDRFPRPVQGRLLVRIDEADHRLRPDQYIIAIPVRGTTVLSWLNAVSAAAFGWRAAATGNPSRFERSRSARGSRRPIVT